MQVIIAFLKGQIVPDGNIEARKHRKEVAHILLQDDILYERGFSLPLLCCTGGKDVVYILREIHKEICEIT